MNKKLTKHAALAALILIATALEACAPSAPAVPTTDPNMIFTQVAQTVVVSMTQTAQAMPPTATPEPTATPAPTATVMVNVPTTAPVVVQPSGPTATIQYWGDAARLSSQTPLDGKTFKVGERINITLCLLNIGSTNWTSKYYLEYVAGPNVYPPQSIWKVGDTIKPGGKWCYEIPVIFPGTAGDYVTRWYFKNEKKEKLLEVYFHYLTAL